MKKTIKILTIVAIILTMMLAFLPSSVLADTTTTTYDLTINGINEGDLKNRKFDVYKIFNVTGSANNYVYTWT